MYTINITKFVIASSEMRRWQWWCQPASVCERVGWRDWFSHQYQFAIIESISFVLSAWEKSFYVGNNVSACSSISIWLSTATMQLCIVSSDGFWKLPGVSLKHSIMVEMVYSCNSGRFSRCKKSSRTIWSKYCCRNASSFKSTPSYSFVNLSITSMTFGLLAPDKQLCCFLLNILFVHS